MDKHSLIIRAVLLTVLCTCHQVFSQTNDVRMPPVITRSPAKEFTYRQDERIPLECEARGAGKLEYTWLKNGARMNLNDITRLEVERNGAKVTIRQASRFDAGYYQCVVSSSFGKVLSNVTQLQQATVGDSAASKDIYEMTVDEGTPFTISAQPHKSFPKPTYNWEMATSTEDNSPQKITLNDRMQMDEDGNLHFAYATKADSLGGNIYKLVTFNQYLDQRLGGSYTRVTVRDNPRGVGSFAPALAFPSKQNDVAVVGRNITLKCFFSANPPAKYTWSTPGLNAARHVYNQYNTELLVKDIVPEDEGEYKCTATNMVGHSTYTIHIDVQSTPTPTSKFSMPRNQNVTEGQSAVFNCSVASEPDSSVIWYKDGEVIEHDKIPPRMRFKNNFRQLIIDEVCRDCLDGNRRTDLMVIQCNASNVHGYILGSGYLNVLLKTTLQLVSDQDLIEIKQDQPDSVNFEFESTSDPSTPVKINWAKVHDINDPSADAPVYADKWITLSGGSITFTVADNETEKWKDLVGHYRCKASNGYSSIDQIVTLKLENIPIAGAAKGGIGDYWWILLIAALLLLLLIILLCCCIYCQRNRGDSYPVDEKERNNGNDPEKEMLENDFHDYQRPEGQPLRGSRGSLGSSERLNSEDEGSLNEYGDVDPGKFTEDGSFVGVYTNSRPSNSVYT